MSAYVTLPLIGQAALFVFMTLLWLIQRRTRNAAIVDVGWAAGLAFLAIYYAVAGGGDPTRRMLVGAMGGLWGLRLASHLFFDRFRGRTEEGRYVALRTEWGANAQRNFFIFFQSQGLLDVLLSAPFLLASLDIRPVMSMTDFLALGLFVVAVSGETLADRQLERFKSKSENRGKTCRLGLWRYSRHPNYFFEWLIWCAFAILALPAPHGWIAPAAPMVIFWLIHRVTGIPPTEAQAVRSRGEDYRDYQRTTNAFFPGPPREKGR